MLKLVVTDLDGTLLDQHHQIPTICKQALQAVDALGIQVMLATGRHFNDVVALAQQLEIDTCLITSNGARVHNRDGELLYENHIPGSLASKVLSLSAGFSVHRNIYQGENWWVEVPNEALLAIHHSSQFSYQLTDFTQLNPEGIDKFYFYAEHELLLPLEVELKAQLGDELYITFTTENYLEVMNKGVSKGQALQAILHNRNICPSEVMAFGDGFNDIDMLQLVGEPVVMQNAHSDIKRLLKDAMIAPANSENGVAHHLHKTVLRETYSVPTL